MKKLFATIASKATTLAMLTFALLTLPSCGEDTPEVPTPVITVTSQQEMNVGYDEAEYTISYTLTDAPAGAVVKAESDASWITGITAAEKTVKFTAQKNELTETRTATITLSYGTALPVKVTVTQDYTLPQPSFKISIDKVSPYSATVTFTPENYTGNYLFLVVKASAIDAYIDAGNLEGWIEEDIEWLRGLASQSGAELSTFLPNYKQGYAVNGEPTTMNYSSLKNNTEYYAYCYGLTPDGEVTTEFFKEKFLTQVVATSDITFKCEVKDITVDGANITVTPSNDTDTYFWTYISEMDYVQYSMAEIVDNMVKNIMYEVQYGTDINTIIHKGVSTEKPQGLWAGTVYHIIAWGMDDHGALTTEPVEVTTFKTLDQATGSGCTFEVDTPQVLDNDIQVHVVPSDLTASYYVALVAVDKCKGYDDNQMAQRLINMENDRFAKGFYGQGKNWTNVDFVLKGEQTKWGRADLDWTFSPNTTYRIFVFAVDKNGNRTSSVKSMDVKTAAQAQSSLTVKVELIASDWDYGTWRFTPSNNTEYYMPFLIATDELKYVSDASGKIDEEELVHQITHYYDDAPNYYTHKGACELKLRWVSDTDYTMLVCGWSGGNTTPFYRTDVHTPKIPFGEGAGDLSVTYELFDAHELMALDYEAWKEYDGFAVISLTLNPNAAAAHWNCGVWMPVSNYASTGGVDHLLTLLQYPEFNIIDRTSGMYRTLGFGETYSLSYVAYDKDGKLGPWHYEEFRVEKGKNTHEPYDFWSKPNPNRVIMLINPKRKSKSITLPRVGSEFGSNVKWTNVSRQNPRNRR